MNCYNLYDGVEPKAGNGSGFPERREGSLGSPAGSCDSITSQGSSPSPSSPPSPLPNIHSVQDHHRYQNVYEERLKPLEPSRSEPLLCKMDRNPTGSNRPLPLPTHHSQFNSELQEKFNLAVEASKYSDIEQLLRSHSHLINIDQYDAAGQTPLHRFIVAGNLELTQLMVRHGADTRLTSRDGWSSLHMAAWSGQPEVMMYVMRCSSQR